MCCQEGGCPPELSWPKSRATSRNPFAESSSPSKLKGAWLDTEEAYVYLLKHCTARFVSILNLIQHLPLICQLKLICIIVIINLTHLNYCDWCIWTFKNLIQSFLFSYWFCVTSFIHFDSFFSLFHLPYPLKIRTYV